MLLITEQNDSAVETIIEEVSGKKKQYITGIFMQAEVKNRNSRVYPKSILESAVSDYVENYVKTGRSGGELNHPATPVVNPDRVSHRITELYWNGNDVMGKALVLNTPMGQIVSGLLEGGCQLGVSSRGMGTVSKKSDFSIVNPGFRLSTVDVVNDPSAPSAFVEGIMEGVSWLWENGAIRAEQIDDYKTIIKKAPAKNLGAIQTAIFKDFLSKF